MNAYATTFTSTCPVNQKQITYELSIETQDVIKVEAILRALRRFKSGYHEDIADWLFKQFGGTQVMRAHHHGVWITTTRGTAR